MNPARYLPSAAYRKAGIVIANVYLDGDRAGTAANYAAFWTAPYKCIVLGVNAIWGTASAAGTLTIERLQGTEATGAGDALLSAVIDTTTAANTVNAGTLIAGANAAPLELAAGDRLGLVDNTPGTCACLAVTVTLAPLP